MKIRVACVAELDLRTLETEVLGWSASPALVRTVEALVEANGGELPADMEASAVEDLLAAIARET